MKIIKRLTCIVMALVITMALTGCLAYTPELRFEKDGMVLTRTVNSPENLMDMLTFYGGDTAKVSDTGSGYMYKDTISVSYDNVADLEGFYGFKTVNAVALDTNKIQIYGTLWDKIDYANMAQGKKTRVRIIDNAGKFKNKDKKSKYIFGMDMDIVFFVYNELEPGYTTVADYGNMLYNSLNDNLNNAVVCTVVLNSGVDIRFIGDAISVSENGRQKLSTDLATYLGNGAVDCDGALNAIIDDLYYDLREKVDTSNVDYSNLPKLNIENAVSINGQSGNELVLFSDRLDESFEIIVDTSVIGDAAVVTTPGTVSDVNNPTNPASSEIEKETSKLDFKTVFIYIIVGLIAVVVVVLVIKKLFGNKEVDVPQNDIAQRNVNRAVRDVNSMHKGKDTKIPKQGQFQNPQFKSTNNSKQDMANMQQSIANANQGLNMGAPLSSNNTVTNNRGNMTTNGFNNPMNNGLQQQMGSGGQNMGFPPQKPQNVFNQQKPQFNQGNVGTFNQGKQPNFSSNGVKPTYPQQQQVVNNKPQQPPMGQGQSVSPMPNNSMQKPTNTNTKQNGVSLEMLSSLGGVQDDEDDWD